MASMELINSQTSSNTAEIQNLKNSNDDLRSECESLKQNMLLPKRKLKIMEPI